MSQRSLNLSRLSALPKPAAGETRICSVNYLNSVPYEVLAHVPGVQFSSCEPAECARRLHEGDTDLALVPIAEFAQHGGYEFLPFGIAANGLVDSVIVFSKLPFLELKKIYLDDASRTSVILLKLLVNQLRGPDAVQFVRRNPNEVLQQLTDEEGVLVIGNRALENRGHFACETDLAKLWKEHTGLPFVFAVWAGHKNVITPELERTLTEAIERGLNDREVRARAWAEQTSFDRDAATNYVRDIICYRLGDSEISGASLFLTEAAKHGLLPRLACSFADYRVPAQGAISRSLDSILADAAAGYRIPLAEGLRLGTEAKFEDLALAADERRRQLHPDHDVSYIIDRNINYTNVCNVYCRFCAFYAAPGKEGGYLLSREEIAEKIEELMEAGGRQILLQGGLNPELGIEYYEDLFRWLKERYPINLHALSADEIWHIVRVSKLSVEATLSRLIAAGLGSLPGGGAEILVDRVRRRIARLKTTAAEWLEAHRVAHRLGITSTCTMMFGVQESWEDRLLHLQKLRALQDETGGFTAFITWSFQDENTNLKKGDTSSTEYLRVQAVSRLYLDNIANLQSSWVTQGPSVGQVGLHFGANDFGSLMLEENVVSAAGTTFQMDRPLIERHIREAGFVPWLRDVHYQRIGNSLS